MMLTSSGPFSVLLAGFFLFFESHRLTRLFPPSPPRDESSVFFFCEASDAEPCFPYSAMVMVFSFCNASSEDGGLSSESRFASSCYFSFFCEERVGTFRCALCFIFMFLDFILFLALPLFLSFPPRLESTTFLCAVFDSARSQLWTGTFPAALHPLSPDSPVWASIWARLFPSLPLVFISSQLLDEDSSLGSSFVESSSHCARVSALVFLFFCLPSRSSRCCF